jgi:hypothetical protein
MSSALPVLVGSIYGDLRPMRPGLMEVWRDRWAGRVSVERCVAANLSVGTGDRAGWGAAGAVERAWLWPAAIQQCVRRHRGERHHEVSILIAIIEAAGGIVARSRARRSR